MTKQIGLTLDAATAARVFPDGEITIPKALDDLIRMGLVEFGGFKDGEPIFRMTPGISDERATAIVAAYDSMKMDTE
jgi:hypothetical protein